MDNKVKIREERISAEEYIYFFKRTDLGVDRAYERQGIGNKLLTSSIYECNIKHNYIDIRNLQKGICAMQNINHFSQQYMYSVSPVSYVDYGFIADGNDIMLQNFFPTDIG